MFTANRSPVIIAKTIARVVSLELTAVVVELPAVPEKAIITTQAMMRTPPPMS